MKEASNIRLELGHENSNNQGHKEINKGILAPDNNKMT